MSAPQQATRRSAPRIWCQPLKCGLDVTGRAGSAAPTVGTWLEAGAVVAVPLAAVGVGPADVLVVDPPAVVVVSQTVVVVDATDVVVVDPVVVVVDPVVVVVEPVVVVVDPVVVVLLLTVVVVVGQAVCAPLVPAGVRTAKAAPATTAAAATNLSKRAFRISTQLRQAPQSSIHESGPR